MSKELTQTSPFFSANVVFINELYQKFLQNPASIDASWAEFFAKNTEEVKSILADYKGPSWASRNLKVIGSEDFDISSNVKKEAPKKDVKLGAPVAASTKDLNIRVANLIEAYKKYGHLAANLDPIGLMPSKNVAEIEINTHEISFEDLEKEVELNGKLGLGKAKISQVIEYLNFIYANKVGCEFEYIRNREQKEW